MPRRKCCVLGRYAAKAKKMKQKRRLETLEERNRRLAKARERSAKCRASETVQQRETRLQNQRERTAQIRALKKDRQRLAQLQEKRNRAAISRVSTQQREARQMDRRDRANKLSASASKIIQLLEARSQEMRHRAWQSQAAQPINKAMEGFNDDSSEVFSQHSSFTFRKTETVKEEPVDCIDECSWNTDEELEHPATVFVKTEGGCEIEDTFQKNLATLDGKEEVSGCPATVFLKSEAVSEIQEAFQEEDEESLKEKAIHGNNAIQDEEEALGLKESVCLEPSVNDNEDPRTKKEPLAPSSESEFLASIRQKIGALSAGRRHHQKDQKLLENF